jgi:hypothetical protein
MAHGWDIDTVFLRHIAYVLALLAFYRLSVQFKRYHCQSSFVLADGYCIKLACVITDAAFDAFFLLDQMGFFLFPGYRLLGAFAEAHPAAGAGFFIDLIVKEGFADAGRTFFVLNVLFVFVAKI